MNQKSAIQVIAEVATAKISFLNQLQDISEKYNIVNNVFACSAHGMAEELTEGYYGEIATYDTLEEAAKDLNVLMHGVRIHEGKVSIGNLYRNLSDVKEERIIDLANSRFV